MDLEITPQPSDEERDAIAAALEEAETRSSPWLEAVLPQRILTKEP